MCHSPQKRSQNILTINSIRDADLNLSVQSPRSAEGWIQGIWPVGGSQYKHVSR